MSLITGRPGPARTVTRRGLMMLALVACASACLSTPPPPGANAADGPTIDAAVPVDGGDPHAPDALPVPDARDPDAPFDCIGQALGFDPSNLEPCDIPEPLSDPTTVRSGLLDTDTGVLTLESGETIAVSHAIVDQPDGPELFVVAVESFTLEAETTLWAIGSRPLVVVALDDLEIAGTLALVGRSGEPGAGGEPKLACEAGGAGSPGEPSFSAGPGGGGGGFGLAGGTGGGIGNGTSTAAGNATGNAALTPLRGGCAGGNGAGTVSDDDSGAGGAGGGAVQLIAGDNLIISGVVTVAGRGGSAGSGAAVGGGGGGAGGAILLEAPAVSIGEGTLTANGGGGGAGTSSLGGATGGDAGHFADGLPAPGGTNEAQDDKGHGGDGGASNVDAEPGQPGETGLTGISAIGGGGGGGAVGRIRINSADSEGSRAKVISPPATFGILGESG